MASKSSTQIIVAIIGAIAVVIGAYFHSVYKRNDDSNDEHHLTCGRVVDLNDSPIVNARVSIVNTPRSETTDANGEFCFTFPDKADFFILRVTHQNHTAHEETFSTKGDIKIMIP
ncbi:carboxypeptidase-like regulatory domain-containing protein [Flavobacterium sp. RHBU_24]|uniref:carboxypeptidase-like regulatory domain-containing protein n=1 Tax=Flavobacterium sp. RHBU_24 TaxID=3391185 RepID=UPI003984D640